MARDGGAYPNLRFSAFNRLSCPNSALVVP